MPTLQSGDGEKREQRPQEVVEVDHTRVRTAAVVFAGFSLQYKSGRIGSGDGVDKIQTQ